MSAHLVIAPIIFPLLVAALILLVERRSEIWARVLGWTCLLYTSRRV